MAQSGYAPVNGLRMYYEIHGSGDPLLLIHGAYGGISMWWEILPELAKTHQVIAVEWQGHSHTADIDRPLRLEALADDMAGLLSHLNLGEVDVVGYSLGGCISLRLAMQHPELVRKFVAISAHYRSDGYYPEVLAGIQQITPEAFAGTPMEAEYLANAPDPANWPVLIVKLKALAAQEFAWPDADIAAITTPALIVQGDADVMSPGHAVSLFKLLGGGVPADFTGSLPKSQLAILPGKTHVTVIEQPQRLLAMIKDFFSAQPGD